MPILFACDRCQRAYELPDVAAGRQAKCECGEMLTVPPETPPQHAAPPAPSSSKPRAPRTLKQAAQMAQQAALPSGSEKPPTQASNAGESDPGTASIKAVGQDPPPIPPVVAHSSDETSVLHPIGSDPDTPRYRKLRQYASGLRSQANRLYWFAGFFTIALVASCAYFWSSSVNQNALQCLLAILVAALAWSAAYSTALLLKATADFLHVAMDVEENTRRTEENTRK